jgi:phosphopantothenoylcysteine decarboxylase / phosphopantothenate---cysteine ligase
MIQSTHSNILLGITGGIAAYKTPELVRRLKDSGADVRVVMTPNAQQFVTSMTLQAVSGHPVRMDLWDQSAENAMSHIELARFADQILIAPASADFIARLASGAADDLLTTICLASDATIYLAPSMNRLMWEDVATQDNIQLLMARGFVIIPPDAGDQACGEFGMGRMPEVENLVDHLMKTDGRLFSGKKILITAGPTIEAIDPVRFISNHSCGKMGYALAKAAKLLGAKVTLISGPVHIAPPTGIEVITVQSALQMQQAVLENIQDKHIFISTAAVADYRLAEISPQKIKKTAETLTLQLTRNPDILHTVAQLPHPPITIGFAAETTDVIAHGEKKLLQKNIDMICVNDVSQASQGFNSDYNAVTILSRNKQVQLPRAHKTVLAQQIMQQIREYLDEKNSIKSIG